MTKKFLVGVSAFVLAAFAYTSADAAYMHTTTLKMGVTSSQVKALQETLNMTASCKVATSGVGSMGMESMYFGAKTKAAVQCFQLSQGLTADGVVGPMSGAKLAMVTGSTSGSTSTPSTPSTSGLTGGAGSVEDYSFVSALNNEEVGEDSENVKVAGLEIEADDSSDLQLTAVKITFNHESNGAGESDDFEDVADAVTIWFGNTKVADLDADEFNDDNDYSKTISLASGAIIRADEKGTLTVAISGASRLDSDDIGAQWSVDFDSVRWVDAQGAVVTDPESMLPAGPRNFTFESYATANDVELEVSLNNDEDDVNEAHTITVDDSDTTDNVPILAFTLSAEGDSDITVNEIPVVLTTSTTDISSVVSSVTLYHGNTEIGSEDVDGGSSTELVTFDDLDLEIGAGDEEEFWVKVDLFGTDEFLTAGTTIQATVQTSGIDAEDESGEELESGDLTGTAVGDAHGLFEDGITVAAGSNSATRVSVDGGDNDYGAFTIKFSVTAVGTDVYLDKTFAAASSTTSSSNAVVVNSAGGGLTNAGSMVLSSSDSDASEQSASYLIREGRTADFTLSLGSSTNPDTNIRAVLYNLAWGLSNGAPTANNYSFDMGVDGVFKTDYVLVQD